MINFSYSSMNLARVYAFVRQNAIKPITMFNATAGQSALTWERSPKAHRKVQPRTSASP